MSRISPSVALVRSSPLNITLPLLITPGRCNRMMLSAVTDLTHPDSPTMPSVSPGCSSNETPSTALTQPSFVEKTVCRSCTSSSGWVNADSLLETRIESVADGVAEDVGGEHRDEDNHAGKVDEPHRVEEITLRVGQHVAPAGRGRLDAEAEEVERCLDQDDLADTQARREDEVALLDRQHFASDQARDLAPSD